MGFQPVTGLFYHGILHSLYILRSPTLFKISRLVGMAS